MGEEEEKEKEEEEEKVGGWEEKELTIEKFARGVDDCS